MRQLGVGEHGAQGVSIRTRPFGRVMRHLLQLGLERHDVSIRTRPFGRVMRWRFLSTLIQKKFQSAPGLSAG